ncbi:Efflux pump FUS6-like protein [Cladobotryum mycophilum]|uniref:Efflux pump FUS6-like protein n=1 Tax=Cladobotryum mycophilum TaxID=491253 RepID=A0ABR0SWV3_9HYPO
MTMDAMNSVSSDRKPSSVKDDELSPATGPSSTCGATVEALTEPDDRIETWRLLMVFACVGLGLFLSLMDATIVATILVNISDEFHDFSNSEWVILSYTLSEVGFAVILARLSDAIGRKTVIVGSFALFLASSMACGASTTLNQLIGFRAVQGIGGAGLFAMALIITTEMSPPGAIAYVSLYVGIILVMGGVIGPVIGGLFSTYSDWRWVFWINGPCTFVPIVLLLAFWPKKYQIAKTVKLKDLDWVGAFLVMAGSILPVFIVQQTALGEYAWKSATTIIILILSALCWIALAYWQWDISWRPRFRHIQPQFPWAILTDRVMMAALVNTILAGFVYLLLLVNIPIRAQIVNAYNPIKSAVLLLPMLGGGSVGCGLSGMLSAKKHRTFLTLNVASGLMIVGSGLLTTIPDTFEPAARQWGYEAILGFGVGMNLATIVMLSLYYMEFEHHAVTQGLIAQMRVFGGSIGVAVSFIVLHDRTQKMMKDILTPKQLDDMSKSPLAILTFSLPQILRARETYVSAFKVDMQICLGISAACLVASLCTYERNPCNPVVRAKEFEDYMQEHRDAAKAAKNENH